MRRGGSRLRVLVAAPCLTQEDWGVEAEETQGLGLDAGKLMGLVCTDCLRKDCPTSTTTTGAAPL